MTRELKLALVVGFLLVLLVSVLIADHLSTARKAKVDQTVTAPPAAQVSAPISVPTEPLVTISQGRGGGIVETGTPVVPGAQAGQDPGVMGQVAQRVGERLGEVATGQAQLPPAMGTTQVTLGNSTPALIPFGQGPQGQVPSGQPAPAMSQQTPADTLRANGAPAPVAGEVPAAAIDPAAINAVTNNTTAPAPAAQPAQATQPARGASESQANERWHTIAQGDSLYSISKRYYGSGRHWQALAKFNSERVGKNGQLRTGVRLRIPTPEVLGIRSASPTQPAADRPARERSGQPSERRNAAGGAPTGQGDGRVYVVKAGDTIGHIAQRELGTTKRANELMKLNDISDAGSLRVGQRLRLPAN